MFFKLIFIILLLLEFFGHNAQSQRIPGNRVLQSNVQPNVSCKKCMTGSGQIGCCMSINSCILSDLQQNYLKIFEYMCVFGQSSFGVCCPSSSLLNRDPNFAAQPSNRLRNYDVAVNRGCGMTTRPYPRVEGERQAEAGEWPWMAAILRKGFSNVFCGGTLITDRHVLTAAHCLNEHRITDLMVRLGEYDFRAPNETRSRDFSVLTVKIHTDFDPITYENDIAIIQLDRHTIFTSYIWPICMPPIQQTWESSTGIVTGWGTQFFGGPYSSVLLEVSVPIWEQKNCEDSYIHYIPGTVFCAGSKEGGRDTCQGDSGGPLLIQLPNQRWVIVGIVSWGLRCGEGAHPGIYTQVDKYVQWISENTAL